MNKNNKEKSNNKFSIGRLVITLLISSFIGWIAGQFLAMPFLLMGRSDPIDSSINYTVSPDRKIIAQRALIIPYCTAGIGFIVGSYLCYKKIKKKTGS